MFVLSLGPAGSYRSDQGTGSGFTVGLKVKLVTVVLYWVYVIIQRKIMSSIFCPKQEVFSY